MGATLDFLKATALSRSREPVFICSDMPIEELAQDMEFSKKWMLGLAAILKKGLRLDMVHDLNRPFGEMMLGLESWIPLYMTGVSPRQTERRLRASAVLFRRGGG